MAGGNGMSRRAVFWYEFSFLMGLLLLACGYIYCHHYHDRWISAWLPRWLGPVPIGVPWYGCMGAVLFSLTGIFEHRHDWDVHYWPWYLARPLIGASLAIVGVLMLQAGILAVGQSPISSAAPTTATPTSPSNLLYYLIAFVVGYNEKTFRDMIKRLTDVILGSTSDAARPVIQGISPATAPHGTPTPIAVTGLNLDKTKSVQMADQTPGYSLSADGKLLITTPSFAQAGNVLITITTDDGVAMFNYAIT
jgi:IPT/TIG domain-containing protein